MTPDLVIDMLTKALQLSLLIASPMLLFGLVIGLIISIFQSVTQIQEMTLTFIPKIIGVIVAVMLFAPWMLDQIMTYTIQLFGNLHNYIGK
ncbi:flagellar biosynthesis protein FliQ [Seleniivibrio sp.]|uniref:flagellar biosynthesis protein FliQ n=1 Tax=Seleniivibrio sp. TaxID=2898801 RepID=UPI0025F4BAEF|nr:flagellar biosynthesis protein FliQ [Seleniivibrio sp.]MCD8553675.1 flagellar biosynthesis protein FliQ [Seleniivibrio sp.]